MAAGFRDYRRISRQRGKILMEIVSAPQTQIARDRESEREIEKERKREKEKTAKTKKFWQMSTAALIFSMYIPSL